MIRLFSLILFVLFPYLSRSQPTLSQLMLDSLVHTEGIIIKENGGLTSIFSGGGIHFHCIGSSLKIVVEGKQKTKGQPDYIAIEVNGKYKGKLAIFNKQDTLTLDSFLTEQHNRVKLLKITEAMVGQIRVKSIFASKSTILKPLQKQERQKTVAERLEPCRVRSLERIP